MKNHSDILIDLSSLLFISNASVLKLNGTVTSQQYSYPNVVMLDNIHILICDVGQYSYPNIGMLLENIHILNLKFSKGNERLA